MTTTIQLDPAAVEAAAKALIAHQQAPVDADYVWDVQFEDGREESRNEARASITAYLAAIEPQVRERVLFVAHAAQTWQMETFGTEEEKAAEARYDETLTNLFALLGMTETTSETTGN